MSEDYELPKYGDEAEARHMSERPGASHWISPFKVAAVMTRGKAAEGRIACVYCTKQLDQKSHTIDHLDGNWRNNAADNIFPCCRKCNEAAFRHRPEDMDRLETRLAVLGITLASAHRRLAKQSAMPLDSRSPEARKLAERWYPERITWLREYAKQRRAGVAQPDLPF